MRKLLLISLNIGKIITVTLLKDIERYFIRVEYEKNGEKIKESNDEVGKEFVYRIVKLIENLSESDNQEIGYLKVFYSEDEYLEVGISHELIDNDETLNELLDLLLLYVDEESRTLVKWSI